MSKKNLFIIIALTTVSICFGIISIYFHTRIQYNRNQNSILEEKVSGYGKQIDELKNELEYYASIPKDPFYEDYKKRISKLIERDIEEIVSEEPWVGGKWFVTEIIFIEPSLVRVHFEDGHNAWVSHIRIIRPYENVKFEEVK